MGAFYLTRKSTNDASDNAPEDREIRALFEKEGFPEPTVHDAGHWSLYLFPKIVSPIENIHTAENGDFCAATGTLLYRKSMGRLALEKLLADHRDGGIDWTQAFGQYAIILFHDGKLQLLTDLMGTYPVWYDDDFTTVSSSFLAVANAAERLTVDPQCIYEYVFQGSTYGNRSLFREVRLHPAQNMMILGESVTSEVYHPWVPADIDPSPLEEQLERNLGNLRRYYDAIATCFGNGVDTALSGGYDSRLTLALLREQGCEPAVHVYGGATDPDVVVATQVATGESFPLDHQDKSEQAPLNPDAFSEQANKNLFAFHGHPPDGLFDNGTDLQTRIARCANGGVALNGGGGEIFRNFFYLPNRSFTPREIVWSFYGGYDPSWCSSAFDERAYVSNKSRKLRQAVDAQGDRLTRAEVEALYPFYRCRYWMGRNNSVNNKLGPALTPFIDGNIVPDALKIPLRLKNSGLFEGRMIRSVSPSLAAYPSDYGHSFSIDPPLRRRIKDNLVYLRPPRLRRLTFRIKNRSPVERPYWLSEAYLSRVIDTEIPFMRQFFRLERVNNLDHLNRIYSLEMLFQHVQPDVSSRD